MLYARINVTDPFRVFLLPIEYNFNYILVVPDDWEGGGDLKSFVMFSIEISAEYINVTSNR